MAKKLKHPEHVNHERWMVSWADFMTLLFALFTALYAISTVDAKKGAAVAAATRAAFKMDVIPSERPAAGGGPSKSPPPKADSAAKPSTPTTEAPSSGSGAEAAGKRPSVQQLREDEQLQDNLKKLQSIVPTLPIKAGISLKASKTQIVLTLKDKAFFRPGSAKLLPEVLPVVDKIAQVLVSSKMYIRVEGHTDDQPSSNKQYTSNWDLSAARAVAFVRYLAEEYAYPPEDLAVAGYSSGHPVASNTTQEGRAANRRVDIILLTRPSDAERKNQ